MAPFDGTPYARICENRRDGFDDSVSPGTRRPMVTSRTSLLLMACSAFFVAPGPTSASEQQARFLQVPFGEMQTATYDLSTIQIIQPGRFSIVATTIDNADLMKLEVNAHVTLLAYCLRAAGKYETPADLLTLGTPDMPAKDIEVKEDKNGKFVWWEYPYSKLAPDGAPVFCKANLDEDNYSRITNGMRGRELFDCKLGQIGIFLNEIDDPSKAFRWFVKPGTNSELEYFRVCNAVMHEVPYTPTAQP